MFILPFEIPENQKKIQLKDAIFSIGSCFAENMGTRLSANKFQVVANPLGTIYTPHSIFKNIRSLLSDGLDTDNFIKSKDIYYHWDTHSALSGTDLNAFRELLQNKSAELRPELLKSDWMIITLGTAHVYKYLSNGKLVANCHKVPQKEFEQVSLTSKEIVEDYDHTRKLLLAHNPNIKIIFSVSPIRHIRDGLVKNNVSKGILLQAIQEIVEKDENAFYFPAYELMIDVLRDYRFYEADMVHPNQQAIDYIWERFVETYMDREAIGFIDQWKKIQKSLAHRPFHPASASHQNFIRSTIKQLKVLESKVDVSSELNELKKQLV